ncbi:hypothetical protein [Wukongibacter sp. M2B1]|uniref:hypothetical protein n=1 Tax=Wukongibacter sp. M2B1 TaxID=3088895 RepID=UPI003D7A8F24
MKRKLYIILLIMLTFITTKAIMYLHPDNDNGFNTEKYFKPSNFLAVIKNEVVGEGEVFHEIDNETLNEFLEFYSNKSAENLEIFEKEEIRYILESMGKYNTDKLKKLLKISREKREERIYKLLGENLFDEQLMILDEMVR